MAEGFIVRRGTPSPFKTGVVTQNWARSFTSSDFDPVTLTFSAGNTAKYTHSFSKLTNGGFELDDAWLAGVGYLNTGHEQTYGGQLYCILVCEEAATIRNEATGLTVTVWIDKENKCLCEEYANNSTEDISVTIYPSQMWIANIKE